MLSFSHCPADHPQDDGSASGCEGCPALPGTEHCEAVFIPAPPIIRPPYGDGAAHGNRAIPKVVILAEAQGWRCPYCNSVMTYDPTRGSNTPRTDATVDHYLAISSGGKRVWENEIAACFDCNVYRGQFSAMLFWLLMQLHAFDRRRAVRHAWKMSKKQRAKFLSRWRNGSMPHLASPSA